MAGPLDGIRVLDLGRVAAGPFCGMIFADLGAEVIRVEKSAGADDRFGGILSPSGYNYNFMTRNRNKKAITLNFEKNERAKEILKELAKHADVIIENFSPNGAKALGITYDNFKAVKPDIIFTHISAFGAEGPYSHRLGFDPIAKAMSGIMSISGFPGSPPTRDGVPYIDYSTALLAAIGVLAALYDRKSTGQGQMIDVSLFQTAITFMAREIAAWETDKIRTEQVGNRTRNSGPSDLYKSKDGKWVFVATLSDAIWARFCRFIGREDLITDPKSHNNLARWEHRDIIDPVVSEWVASKTAEELVAAGEKIPIPVGICYDQYELAHDPHVQAMEMLVKLPLKDGGEVLVSRPPLRMSGTPLKIERSFPDVGEHNEEIYGGLLGYIFDLASDALAELLRITVSGGHILLGVMSSLGTWRLHTEGVFDLIQELGLPRLQKLFEDGDVTGKLAAKGTHHCHMFRWSELRNLIEEQRCDIVAVSACSFLPNNAHVQK